MTDYQSYFGFSRDSGNSAEEVNLERLKRDGFFLAERVFPDDWLQVARDKMDRIWQRQLERYGEELLSKIGDFGQIRAMMADDPFFFESILNPVIDQVVRSTVGDTAILHLQNGIVTHPQVAHQQSKFHKDFPKDFISTRILSLNALILIDEFNATTGGTWLVPGSHLFPEMPSDAYLKSNQTQLRASAGSVLFFNSMLWHRGGENTSKNIRRAINQQFTRPFIKQQIDYPALMHGKVDRESRLAQRLGMWSVPPKSVDEFRVNDPSQRTYRAGQG